ncbi:MAG: TIGR00375 family protein [Candidatus Atribacteria bacterium]|nr:TIGR00375 family protein [Candidatus Atribacteria bacterium]
MVVKSINIQQENSFFMDLHVHIGSDQHGLPVKVTASRELTFANIARECQTRKGIDIVGIVDCASPRVIDDIGQLIQNGEMKEIHDGGLRYHDTVTVILGSEIETREKSGGLSHQIAFFPYFVDIREFSKRMNKFVTNLNLSSQNCGLTAQEFFHIVNGLGGILIPAHVFTPYKSIFGNCVDRLKDMFTPSTIQKIPAIELGLSADTDLADSLEELSEFTFLTNSDAHSLGKIGREYNLIQVEQPTYQELLLALKRENGRKIIANYGLDPKLGKYHRTHCEECNHTAVGLPPVFQCERCGSKKVTKGVLDRIVEISQGRKTISPLHRPPYYHQVALSFVPGIGKKTLEKLFSYFGTEMNILHKASHQEISKVVGFKIADDIIAARNGELTLIAGGGGRYGKVSAKSPKEDASDCLF